MFSPLGVTLFDGGWKSRLNEKLEMRNAKWWCGAQNLEAPRSINYGDARRWYLVTSHESPVTSNP